MLYGISTLYMKESPKFHQEVKCRMDKLRVGNPMDKSVDLGAIDDPKQLESISHKVEQGLKEGGKKYVGKSELPDNGYFCQH